MTINGLVRWTIVHGAAGLEAWLTRGQWRRIFGNAHFGGRSSATSLICAAGANGFMTLLMSEMARLRSSRLQDTGPAPLISECLKGACTTARWLESLAFRKRTQPLDTPSAGCVFQNPERGRDSVPEGIPWSAGALVDRAGLKGARVGGASVSTTHGNFIVNDGSARARDIRGLIDQCRSVVRERFGVELREEIVYLGDFGD